MAAKKKIPSKPGRPTKYDPSKLVPEICERLANKETLADICRDSHMPSHDTVTNWRHEDEAINRAIVRAREAGYERLAAECVEIADNPEKEDRDVQRDRLRVDTRLKLLAKWFPTKYGDKIALSNDEERPLKIIIGGSANG